MALTLDNFAGFARMNSEALNTANLVLSENGYSLTTTKQRGGVNTLAGLMNIGRRATYGKELIRALGNAMRTYFGERGAIGAQQDFLVDSAFREVLGKSFADVEAKAVKLNAMKITALVTAAKNAAQEFVFAGGSRVRVGERAFGFDVAAIKARCDESSVRETKALFDANQARVTFFGEKISLVSTVQRLLAAATLNPAKAVKLLKDIERVFTKLVKIEKNEGGNEISTFCRNMCDELTAKAKEVRKFAADATKEALERHPLSREKIDDARSDWVFAGIAVLQKTIMANRAVLPKNALDFWPRGMTPEFGENGLCTNVKNVFKLKMAKELVKSFKAKLAELNPGAHFDFPSDKAFEAAITAMRKEFLEGKSRFKKLDNTFTSLGGVKFRDVIVPGKQLGVEIANIYGRKIEGRLSGDMSCKEPTNLWNTTFGIVGENGETKRVFSGVRHGACTAPQAGEHRTENSRSRAQGVLKADFLARADLVERARESDCSTPETAIEFDFTNISLMSCTWGRFERSMVDDHLGAFDHWNNRAIKMTIDDGKGGEKEIYVKPRIASFTFSVQPLTTGKAGAISVSSMETDRNLGELEKFMVRVDSFCASDAPAAKRRAVKDLMNDVLEIYRSGRKNEGIDVYKLPARIAVAAYLMGEIPSFNCKSGKDRTGEMDVECKFLATLIEKGLPIPRPGEKLSEFQSILHRDIALKSGNIEIQALNTGLGGFKTSPDPANKARFGVEATELERTAYRGGEMVVKS